MEQIYRDSTLKVLFTFEVDRGLVGFDRASSIRFQLFREQWVISYIEFSLLSGLYDIDYTSTPQYEEPLIDFLSGVTAKGMW